MELFKLFLHSGLDWEGCSRLCWTDFGRFVTFSQTQWQSFLFRLCWWFSTSQLLSICMREILSTLTSNQKTFFAKIGTTKLYCFKYRKGISCWNVWHFIAQKRLHLKAGWLWAGTQVFDIVGKLKIYHVNIPKNIFCDFIGPKSDRIVYACQWMTPLLCLVNF